MKIIVFIANALIQLAAGGFGLVILLIVMNGYSESDATPGILLYIFLAVLSAIGVGVGGVFAAQKLIDKTSLGNVWSSLIAVLIFAVAGAVVLLVGIFAAVLTAEAMRK